MIKNKYIYCKALFQPNCGRFWLIEEKTRNDYYKAYAHAQDGMYHPYTTAKLSSKRHPILMDYSEAEELGIEAGKKEYKLKQLLMGIKNES